MLKVLLETLEGVDDAQKPFYAEADGKFVLQVEGIDNHPDVASLKNAYSRTKDSEKLTKGEVAALKTQIADLQKGAPDTAATQAKIAEIQGQLDAERAKTGELSGKLTGVTRDRALTDALQQAGVTNPAFVKAAQAMLSGMVKVEGDAMFVETGMGPQTLPAFIKAWVAGEGQAFVSPAQGGGAKGNEGGAGSVVGNLGGTPKERQAALKQRFPDLK